MRPFNGWGRHPELRASLELLVAQQQYTLADVGDMFGVSRERVRQWCVREGIESARFTGLASVRLWNDARNCFEPARRLAIKKTLSAEKQAEAKRRMVLKRLARYNNVVDAIVLLSVKLKRSPTTLEILLAVDPTKCTLKPNGAGGALGAYLCAPGKKFSPVMSRAFRDAGVVQRPVGGAGHVNQKHRATRCAVHATEYSAENATLVQGRYWRCKACQALKDRLRYANNNKRQQPPPPRAPMGERA